MGTTLDAESGTSLYIQLGKWTHRLEAESGVS